MNESWVETLARGRWADSALAMTAAVAVAWPLGQLVSAQPWAGPLVGILVLLVVVGSAVRAASSPRWVVLVAQVVALCSALSWWVRTEGGAGDDESAVAATVAVVREGIATIEHYAVPAPATTGLTFIVLTGLVLLALAVEALGVTLRAAALAGVPLLLVSASTASSTGEAADPRYFLIAAGCWLVLLARQNRTVLEEWRAAGRQSATTVDRAVETRGSRRRFGFVARTMGVAGLALAVAVPGLLPHLPTTVLLDGVGRGGAGATGTVSFTETLDLAQDLADRSNTPVLRYRTDDTSPPPLRVTVSTDYAEGKWSPAVPSDFRYPLDGDVGTASSFYLEDFGIEGESAEMTVTQNGMRAPQLALPYPPTAVGLGGIGLQWDPVTDVAYVDEAPQTYDVSYTEVGPLEALPEQFGMPAERLLDVLPVEDTVQRDDGAVERYGEERLLLGVVHADSTREYMMTDGSVEIVDLDGTTRREASPGDPTNPFALDPVSADRVQALADELAGDLTNTIDVALEFQRYLRGPEFTYSLTLAGPVEGPDGRPLDPISHFLETKRGYCTQFATAMVMMARSQGIAARLAVGFLKGDAGLDGTRTVVAADAHAWPELFIAGLGWTRFEPTPGTRAGLAPSYLTPTQAQRTATPEAEQTVAEPTPDPTVAPVPDAAGGGPAPGWWERHGAAVGWSALGLAGLVLLGSVVPLAGWLRREGWRSRRGLGPSARIEREWSVLLMSLADLGVPAPPAATPRGLRAHYLRELDPDAPTRDALTRAAARLEAARYAAEPAGVGTMREDVRRVVEWWRRRVPRRRRLLAALLPASGRAAFHPRGTTPPSAAAAHRG